MGNWLWSVPIVVSVAMGVIGYMLVCLANASDCDIQAEGTFSPSAAGKASATDWGVVYATLVVVGISGVLAILFPTEQWLNWICCIGVMISEAVLMIWLASWVNKVWELIWATVQMLLPYFCMVLIANNLAIPVGTVQLIFVIMIVIMVVCWAQGYYNSKKEVN